MAGIAAEVMESFFERLERSDDVPAEAVEKLKRALAQERLPKADAIAELYRENSGDAVA